MASVVAKSGSFSVRAYRGDAKTLLAFDLDRARSRNLAGFTIQCRPEGQPAYYLLNELQFARPADHAQDPTLPPNSSINAPIHKFRWLHVPGSAHQGIAPVFGRYEYTVTPRYFDDKGSLGPLDPTLAATVAVQVGPFTKESVSLGFTRGFVQSQAFVHHFGVDARIQPKGHALQFDTGQESGVNAKGAHFTFEDEYRWLGFTARQRVFEILDEVAADPSLTLDVFAYDLNEPQVIGALLKLAGRGSVRIILDNSSLHHGAGPPKPEEDQFETLFGKAAKKPAAILRGKFDRFSHDKIFIVSDPSGPKKVLTGSTNLSITGLYVNSNHVVIFDDRTVAKKYADVFEESWKDKVAAGRFRKSTVATTVFSCSSATVPAIDVTFSPHDDSFAKTILDGLVARVAKEGRAGNRIGSVLFAVMEMKSGTGPVFPALTALHANQTVFSYGISDNPGGIALYRPGQKTGVLVTGKPASTKLPKPFSQVPGVGSGHQIHHKFVVCGFNGDAPVVYCGSSNLALGGEQANGDNLIAIHDGDIATVFAIEALSLVDHFDFLDNASSRAKGSAKQKTRTEPSKRQAAVDAGWFLSTDDKWAKKYFDPKDLKSVDRELFA